MNSNKDRVMDSNKIEPGDIAIIGLSLNFPCASDQHDFWRNLCAGKNCITEFPADRKMDVHDYLQHRMDKKYDGFKPGGYLKEIDKFDNSFFKISKKEADVMDPNQRIFLQSAWAAIEDSGNMQGIKQKTTGIFFGYSSDFGVEYKTVVETLAPERKSDAIPGNIKSIIASRIAYLLDLKGPSMLIDTACSSALVALHLACNELRNDMCEYAIVGSGKVILFPCKPVGAESDHIGVESISGVTRTFDDDSDGTVFGEGFGTIVLKKYKNALADRDNVYAIIKGSAVNQDGATIGITAPNADAQTALLIKAWSNANVDPETISCIECHGTGTKLGDPIEIKGITQAFQQFTVKKQFCAVGSVKTNIGHLDHAAGIAGIIKAILSIKNKTIPPTINFKKPNRNINFINSPVYVNNICRVWTSEQYPRRCGVSAFGLSGTNCHVVLEEAHEDKAINPTDQLPQLFTISAKSKSALNQFIQKYVSSVCGNDNLRIEDICYTANIGKGHYTNRIAFVCKNKNDFTNKIVALSREQNYEAMSLEGIYFGIHNVVVEKDETCEFNEVINEDVERLSVILKQKVIEYTQKRECASIFDEICELYIRGGDINWSLLYENTKYKIVSLPTYPFEGKRCWAEAGRKKHPLIDRIILQSADRDIFETRFMVSKYWELNEHKVLSKHVLPGVAYLEMVAGLCKKHDSALELKDVVFTYPMGLFVDENLDVQTIIKKDENTNCPNGFIINSFHNNKWTTHAHGKIEESALNASSIIDINRIVADMRETKSDSIANMIGVEYGPHWKIVKEVFTNGIDYLARIELGTSMKEEIVQYCLHPSMFDVAANLSIGMIGEGLYLPWIYKSICIKNTIPSNIVSYVVRKRELNKNIGVFDVTIADEKGNIVVEIKDYQIKKVVNASLGPLPASHKINTDTTHSEKTMIMAPVWEELKGGEIEHPQTSNMSTLVIAETLEDGQKITGLNTDRKFVILDRHDSIEAIKGKIAEHDIMDNIYWIGKKGGETSIFDGVSNESQEDNVFQVFRVIKALSSLGYVTKKIRITFITRNGTAVNKNADIDLAMPAVFGLVGSLTKEYLHWHVRIIDFDAGEEWSIEKLPDFKSVRNSGVVSHRRGRWYHQKLIPCEINSGVQDRYRRDGVYIVIGGAGGIGEVWTEFMIREYNAKIIWIGRRKEDETIRKKIKRLAAIGVEPIYICADARKQEELTCAIKMIKKTYSDINGVIHSAIVLADQSIERMGEERFREGYTAKVDVCTAMGQAFCNEKLDFVLFFSSLNSYLMPAGQSNYTAGSIFVDAYAKVIEKKWNCPAKVINWGYWGSAGAVATPEYQERLHKAGFGSIEPLEGMSILRKLVNSELSQISCYKLLNPVAIMEEDSQEFLTDLNEEEDTRKAAKRIIIPSQEYMDDQKEANEELDKMTIQLIYSELKKMGILSKNKQNIDDCISKYGVKTEYKRWLKESLRLLKVYGYVEYDTEGFQLCNSNIPGKEPWDEWIRQGKIWKNNKDLNGKFKLINATVRSLSAIITGEKLATEIIFPKASMQLVEGIYSNNNITSYCNKIVGGGLNAYVAARIQLNKRAKIRIFEIGAGTGGTSKVVLEKINAFKDAIQEYRYTDISRSFLINAEEKYAAQYPYLKYDIFNVEKPLALQDVELGGYDVVIATNVLHATQYITEVIRNAKAILKKNGILIINEITRNSAFNQATFGLLDGWWMYGDEELRIPGSPIVRPDEWRNILSSEGLSMVCTSGDGRQDIGQLVIFSMSDGIVRQNIGRDVSGKAPKIKNVVVKTNEVAEKQRNIREYARETIRRCVAESLKIDIEQINNNINFSEYGVDSIVIVDLVHKINTALNIEVDITKLFDYVTINQLARYIETDFKAQLKSNPKISEGQADSDKKQIQYDIPRVTIDKRREQGDVVSGAPDSIAIIGMSGRFAQSRTVEELWENIKTGKDLVEKVGRWDLGKEGISCNYGSFLDDIDRFDPLFFNISGHEAMYMDPQQRIFLEETWRALEDGGYAGRSIEGKKCGVYVGCVNGDYNQLFGDDAPAQAFWGNSGAVIPARVAYYLDLHGPAIAIDTACSSSLVAIHLANQSLLANEVEIAIAGGVFIQVTPEFYRKSNRAGMLSANGRCYTFDQRADGFVPGEGAGVVLLKRMKDAMRDRDHIYGVIRGSGINQDGATNGITAPSGNAQESLERQVYASFNINPERIQMVEAHGTGTRLGDPIEVGALTRAFSSYTDKRQFCAIGSIKANVGHTIMASGIAGVIKILLAFKYEQIPPEINFVNQNPSIEFKNSPFYVNKQLKKWESETNKSRMAAVSAFGFSGTNAHIVLEEAPIRSEEGNEATCHLVVLSALTRDQLRRLVTQLVTYIGKNNYHIGDISYTLLLGRRHFDHRFACVVDTLDDLQILLKKWLAGESDNSIHESSEACNSNDLKALKQEEQRCDNQKIIDEYNRDRGNKKLLEKIATLFVQQYDLEYEKLFDSLNCRRIPLPVYQFEKDRYWVNSHDDMSQQRTDIHPLLHKNISDLSEQKFVSVFTGSESELHDHLVQGYKVMPGAAVLELARAGVEKSVGKYLQDETHLCMKKVNWIRPIIVEGGPREIYTGIKLAEDGKIVFSIHDGGNKINNLMSGVYCSGGAIIQRNEKNNRLDFDAIMHICNEDIVMGSECYNKRYYDGINLMVGPSLRAIEKVYIGKAQLLAELRVPQEVNHSLDQYILHPSIIDASFQLWASMRSNEKNKAQSHSQEFDSLNISMPFSINEIHVYRKCVSHMWAWSRRADDRHENQRYEKYDIDICDENGELCIKILGYTARYLIGSIKMDLDGTNRAS